MFCFSRANLKSTNLKKKVFELKNRQVYFIYPFPCWLKLGQSLQTCCNVIFFFYLSWHFKQEKFIFWKESFFAKQELITHARLCVPDYTTGIRISLLISDIMTKSLAFFWGKLHVICKLSKLFLSYICIWPDINTRGVRRILDSYANRIFPTPLLFVSGYTNTENVF